ncbi:MAG: DEAD/DEAH box helicase family protein [Bacteroidales bacterium]|nr:DEAD/DEAH box helicase family protein [Bacteroidales bacterium]
MTPEQIAREKIDRMFAEAGWAVVNRDHYSPEISAVAVEEGLMKGNCEADYLLFINGKAVGVLEAKREEVDVTASVVAEQAEHYAKSVPHWCQAWHDPLPLAYVSNGKDLFYRDLRNPDSSYEPIKKIHSPKEITRMLGITDFYAALPTLQKRGLRDCQYEAITELEKSFRAGQNRALMVLATGAGKTYTACLATYRMLNYTPMKRVLFLVDRNNLGKQAEGEFGTFRLTENGDPLNTIFEVNRLKSAKVKESDQVVISTIQRLFSLLSGQPIDDSDDDEATEDAVSVMALPPNPLLPLDFFDMIIIDECHRSIYGNWKAVLEYFKTAKLVGLTATPVPETLAFFNNNQVVNYTLEKSIVDGVNVDYRVYRIKTQATEDGGAIREGDQLRRITRYTGKVEDIKNREIKNYTATELNRSIVNPAQIKLILETYRDAVYSEMFTDPKREPNMNYLPKTLIFALNDAHATNIVNIAKEVFGSEITVDPNRFVQKITYSAGDSNALIRSFRNDKDFRIAVTVTLVATGTDVKPLEVVMFMRDVESQPLYTQMKGRGVRTIGDEQLRNVTPNAFSKDIFFLVDAVGVTEHTQPIPTQGGAPQPPIITLRQLLERLTHGEVHDDHLRLIAGRLARIHNKATEEERSKFEALAHASMSHISTNIYQALEAGTLPLYLNVNEPNNERKGLVRPLAVHPDAREYLCVLNAGFINILQPGEDTLIEKGFSQEEAVSTTKAFEEYIETHRDEIEALRIIYNNTGEPLTYTILKDLERKLREVNHKFNVSQLWNNYSILNPKAVHKFTTKDEKDALTNIIQVIRYAMHLIPELRSLPSMAAQRFELWCGQAQRPLSESQKEVIRQIVSYIVTNGSTEFSDIKEYDKTIAAQIIKSFGNATGAKEAIISLSQFLIFNKKAA